MRSEQPPAVWNLDPKSIYQLGANTRYSYVNGWNKLVLENTFEWYKRGPVGNCCNGLAVLAAVDWPKTTGLLFIAKSSRMCWIDADENKTFELLWTTWAVSEFVISHITFTWRLSLSCGLKLSWHTRVFSCSVLGENNKRVDALTNRFIIVR
jgi:hypothetical protein